MNINKEKVIRTTKNTGAALAWIGIGIVILIVGITIISLIHAVSPTTDVTGVTIGVFAICIAACFYGGFKF